MPMIIDQCAIYIAVGIAGAVSWHPLLHPPMGSMEYYSANKKCLRFAPPGWLFPFIWLILYALIIAAQILHLFSEAVTGVPASENQIAVIALWFVNISLNHLWSRLFFEMQMPKIAIIDLLGILGTAIAVFTLYFVQGQWISGILYAPYIVWLVFALALNGLWIARVRPTTPSGVRGVPSRR